jgi:hypothetical protein
MFRDVHSIKSPGDQAELVGGNVEIHPMKAALPLLGILLWSAGGAFAQAARPPGAGKPAEAQGKLSPAGPGVVVPRADVPDARPLASDQARALLEWDWLYQADGNPFAQRSLAEIGWARDLAARLAAMPAKPDFTADLSDLATLELKLQALAPTQADDAARQLYIAVRRVKRRITFKNPLLDFNRFLVIERPYPPGQVHQSEVRLGACAQKTVGRMVLVEGFDLAGPVRDLMPDREGVHWRADLSFDARTLLFSFKAKDLLKLIAWVDMNCVYRGLEEIRKLPAPLCRNAPTIDRMQPVSDK